MAFVMPLATDKPSTLTLEERELVLNAFPDHYRMSMMKKQSPGVIEVHTGVESTPIGAPKGLCRRDSAGYEYLLVRPRQPVRDSDGTTVAYALTYAKVDAEVLNATTEGTMATSV